MARRFVAPRVVAQPRTAVKTHRAETQPSRRLNCRAVAGGAWARLLSDVRGWEVWRKAPRTAKVIPGVTRVIVALAETLILVMVFTVAAAVLLSAAWRSRGKSAA